MKDMQEEAVVIHLVCLEYIVGHRMPDALVSDDNRL